MHEVVVFDSKLGGEEAFEDFFAIKGENGDKVKNRERNVHHDHEGDNARN